MSLYKERLHCLHFVPFRQFIGYFPWIINESLWTGRRNKRNKTCKIKPLNFFPLSVTRVQLWELQTVRNDMGMVSKKVQIYLFGFLRQACKQTPVSKILSFAEQLNLMKRKKRINAKTYYLCLNWLKKAHSIIATQWAGDRDMQSRKAVWKWVVQVTSGKDQRAVVSTESAKKRALSSSI